MPKQFVFRVQRDTLEFFIASSYRAIVSNLWPVFYVFGF